MPSPQEQMAMQQPMPMPQPMMSPEQIGEQMAQVESDAGAMGVGIGQELVNRMMQGLDSAETPKDLMDSIRGNDRSVDERRTELAEFVGEEDAEQTPETVLAMVQPTIMLTERGAMDSGVGELMEGVADVDMETMEGEPTDVGGGVASLMGVGQQPVQNFRYGGIVQKFDLGGDATSRQLSMAGSKIPPQPLTFADYIKQGSQIVESLYPDQDNYFKKMAMLNLANLGVTTGLGLASGRSPSGQPLTGNFISKAAQIGTEISPELTKSAMSLAQAKQAQEQAQKQQALTIGTSLYSASKPEFIQRDPEKDLIGIVNGKPTTFIEGTPEIKTPKTINLAFIDDDNTEKVIPLNLTDPEDNKKFKLFQKTKKNSRIIGTSSPSMEQIFYKTLNNNDLRKAFQLGEIKDDNLVLQIQNAIEYARTNKEILNEFGEKVGTKQVLTPAWKLAEKTVIDNNYYSNMYGSFDKERIKQETPTEETPAEETPAEETPTKETMKEPHLIENVDGSFVDANKEVNVLNRVFKNTEDIDFTLATGYGDIFTRGIDALKMGASEIPGLEGVDLSKRKDAVNYIKTLFKTAKLAVRDEIGGKAFASDVADLRDEYPEDLGLLTAFTDIGFLGRLKRHVGRMEMALETINKEILANPMSYKTSTVARARERKIIFEQLLRLYAPVIEDYENKTTSQKETTIGDPKKYDMRK